MLQKQGFFSTLFLYRTQVKYMIPLKLLEAALLATNDGVVITESGGGEEDRPIIYVNPAFQTLTGYTLDEILGRDCRFLNISNHEQESLNTIRQALRANQSCRVVLHNRKKNGEPFWNELSLSPVFDENHAVTHFIGIQKDVTERVRHEQHIERQNQLLIEKNKQLEELVVRDPLTQLHNRRYFEEHLNRSWSVHERLKAKIAVAFIDIDCFKLYNDHYGHLEGDTALRLVAQKISSFFSRDSDIVARYGGEEFVIVSSIHPDAPPFIERAEKMRQAIYDLAIKHEKSKVSEFVTISLGVCTGVPPARSTPSLFTRKADAAMYQAKHLGGNNTVHTEF